MPQTACLNCNPIILNTRSNNKINLQIASFCGRMMLLFKSGLCIHCKVRKKVIQECKNPIAKRF
ncbi:hypothetical protein BRYFOR_06704 [Marvinbryantia formatexigens DSM 14469]|uniref:Uncharacterized protein n=1 Tax=Marvinbryantia formatexigens DSM 14469 TaxID=478749 RepID=C6LD46_9FIRM|nr:hypothetical protein BRYFOR_06704 [Marvinbryantia formatexigens DSM 14469]